MSARALALFHAAASNSIAAIALTRLLVQLMPLLLPKQFLLGAVFLGLFLIQIFQLPLLLLTALFHAAAVQGLLLEQGHYLAIQLQEHVPSLVPIILLMLLQILYSP